MLPAGAAASKKSFELHIGKSEADDKHRKGSYKIVENRKEAEWKRRKIIRHRRQKANKTDRDRDRRRIQKGRAQRNVASVMRKDIASESPNEDVEEYDVKGCANYRFVSK